MRLGLHREAAQVDARPGPPRGGRSRGSRGSRCRRAGKSPPHRIGGRPGFPTRRGGRGRCDPSPTRNIVDTSERRRNLASAQSGSPEAWHASPPRHRLSDGWDRCEGCSRSDSSRYRAPVASFPLRPLVLTLATALMAPALLVAGAAPAPARAARADAPPDRLPAVGHRRRARDRHVLRGDRARRQVRLGSPRATTTIGRTSYDVGSWTSPWVSPGFALTELVPSWTATTPEGTLVQVDVRGVGESGTRSSWDTLGRWASGDASFRRTSLGAQTDDLARVSTDTWVATYGGFRSWQLRVRLLSRAGTTLTPLVGTVGASSPTCRRRPGHHLGARCRAGGSCSTSRASPRWCTRASTPSTAAAARPGAPRPRRRWCWPTTRAAAGLGVRLGEESYVDRAVDHAARMTFDPATTAPATGRSTPPTPRGGPGTRS